MPTDPSQAPEAPDVPVTALVQAPPSPHAFSAPTLMNGVADRVDPRPSATSVLTAPASPPSSDDSPSLLGHLAQRAGDVAGSVVVGSLSMIGVRYRWGGTSPSSGLDCSGFVRYVFQDTLGLQLPRRAEDMAHTGRKVALNELQPGDLVFFNTMRRTFSHVGIYVGNHQFIHSPRTGEHVRIDAMDDDYWEHRFTGARRVADPATVVAPDDRLAMPASMIPVSYDTPVGGQPSPRVHATLSGRP